MSAQIIIGKSGGKNVGFSIAEMLPTRLLIQANSGGGKSWLLRKIFEESFGKIQTFVIDVAGEFASLREKYGYVLVGEGGETPADLRSAGLVAEKLLELRASAVFDLYSLKPADRHQWVKNFLAAMMNAPKKLWHPVLVAVDEAHKFMPERGEGESIAKPEMLSLCSDGRKYGYCAVLATQRLAKLDKSGAADLLNVMIGPTFMDIDLERAHKALGLVRSERAAFDEQMKTIHSGNFWALGRALSKKRILVTVGKVQTSHPKPGVAHVGAPPPAPEKIKSLLPKLADLPQEAEAKARTEAEFRREIRELKTQLAAKVKPVNITTHIQPQAKILAPMRAALQEAVKLMAKISTMELPAGGVDRAQVEAAVKLAVDRILGLTTQATAQQGKQFEQVKREAKPILEKLQRLLEQKPAPADVAPDLPPAHQPKAAAVTYAKPVSNAVAIDGGGLRTMSVKIAGVLAAYYPDSVKRKVVAALVGATDGGGFGARLSDLRVAGFLEDVTPGVVRATDAGAQKFLGAFQAPSNTREVMELWRPKLREICMLILEKLVESNGEPVRRADLADAVGATDGGGFGARLSDLRVAGLLVDAGKGLVAANKETLFLNGRAA